MVADLEANPAVLKNKLAEALFELEAEAKWVNIDTFARLFAWGHNFAAALILSLILFDSIGITLFLVIGSVQQYNAHGVSSTIRYYTVLYSYYTVLYSGLEQSPTYYTLKQIFHPKYFNCLVYNVDGSVKAGQIYDNFNFITYLSAKLSMFASRFQGYHLFVQNQSDFLLGEDLGPILLTDKNLYDLSVIRKFYNQNPSPYSNCGVRDDLSHTAVPVRYWYWYCPHRFLKQYQCLISTSSCIQ